MLLPTLHCLRIWWSLLFCFQNVDYSSLEPIRYTEVNHSISGLCVSSSWLVVTGWDDTVRLYSLPGLELHHHLMVRWCHHPRVDSDGVVYVPGDRYIAVLQITDSGKMTEIRKYSSVGGLGLGGWLSVTVGPESGQLCLAQWDPPRLWVMNVSDNSLLHNLTLPDACDGLLSVAALVSGQLMISYRISRRNHVHSLAVYRSWADSPSLLTNLTSVGDRVYGLTGSGNHFLAPYYYQSDLLILGTNGSVLHTVDAVSGRLGLRLYEMEDATVWQDCIWLGGWMGDLVLLC